MATTDKRTLLLRQLIPKSYHFDGYSEINCPNSRDKPFFSDNVIPMGNHYLTTRLVDKETISIEFSSSCQTGIITFEPCLLSIADFAKKIKEATTSNRDCIFLEIKPNYQFSCKCDECNHLNNGCSYLKFKCDETKCNYSNRDCSYLKSEHPPYICAAVSFNFSEMKEALAMYFEITTSITEHGGSSTMATKRKNKFFGLNFEFGLCKDSNISSTLMGIAVKNQTNNSWYVFDPNTQTRKNIANMKMGNFPMVYVPTNKYVVGKLYKIDGQYYYVKSISPNGTVTLINGADGIIREQIPEESLIPGMNFYTEVVAFDASNMMNPTSGENVSGNILAAFFMMQWSKGGDKVEFSLDDIDDDSFNGLGAYLPMLLASGNGFSNIFASSDGQPNIGMLMALGSGSGENDELFQMMLLNQLFGNNAINTPFSGNIFQPQQIIAPTVSTDSSKVICEKCAGTYPTGTNFCPKCGGKTRSIAKSCYKCGATLMYGASFCHKCGAKVGMPNCSKCGTQFHAGTNFCPKCGTPVNSVETPLVTLEATSKTSVVETPTADIPTATASDN